MEGHPVERGFRAALEGVFEVPRDRFALAVRVGGEVDRIGFGGGFAQAFDDRAAPRSIDVLRGEVVFDVDAEAVGGQIADVPHRRRDEVVLSEHPTDGPRLGRRLDDKQIGHFIALFQK